MHATNRRILVFMPTVNRPERLKLEGLLVYAHEKKGDTWHVELASSAWSKQDGLKGCAHADGVVAYISSPEERTRLVSSSRPTVLIEDLMEPVRITRRANVVTLLCDHAAEGRTAADYFLARHFRHFAWVGSIVPEEWGERRRTGFADRIRAHGHDCFCYTPSCANFTDDFPFLGKWLASLPRPCALFAVHDFRARHVLEAALSVGLRVPEDLAVLGVDDDELVCTTATPALSSIPTHDHLLGLAAGRILNELILGCARGGRLIRVRHTHVTTRLSTDADALSDPFVAKALRWARAHLDASLDAETLARQVGYSKHMLQIRAERALGVTLGTEIRRLRLSAAMEKLANTSASVDSIAAECGFTSSSHLSLRLKEATGHTPRAYRRFSAL